MPPKISSTIKGSNETKVVSSNSPKKTGRDVSGNNVRDNQESSITQILSQRLGNMEQQLVLLRGDLKDAVETLKRKDQEITTLENKIVLAERRRDFEKNGGQPAEDLRDLSEDFADPKLKSKQDLLQKECEILAQKLQEMEKFFGDYGLVWVKEDALDEKDPNNLWVRKTNIHYTPDFDKIFLVVEELNVGNAEPQIVKTENTAQFKTADLLNLTLYADGIQLENNPFRLYDSPSVEEFFRDLEDGYFPTELKGQHPEGVIFKVKDMRNTKYAEDPNRRPNIRKDQNVVPSPRKKSTSSVSYGPKLPSPENDVKCKPGVKSDVNACRLPRRSGTVSRKGSTSSRRSIIKNVTGKATDSSKVVDGKPPLDSANSGAINEKVELDKAIKPAGSEGNGDQKLRPIELDGTDTKISPGNDGETPKTLPEAVRTENEFVADGVKTEAGASDGTTSGPSTATVNGAVTDTTNLDSQSTDTGLKQLFVGKSPQVSATRVPNGLEVNPTFELEKEMTADSFGLPRPPLSTSVPDRLKDFPRPVGPPSKHFDNFFLNKAEETQTSGTYVTAQTNQPQPPPTHITNITYNEAPITIQMTPSELKDGERKTAPTALNVCPIHHPHPCDCLHGPPPSATPVEDGGIGPVHLVRIPGETEYREKYTEGAINSTNVLQQKKRSQEQEKAKSHDGSAKIASPPPILVEQDVAPIPPDPLTKGDAFDPNVQWPNFVYFGHPKGQDVTPPPPTPASPPFSAKTKADSPQVIQLNKKTSERMISVKMRTKSGSKEYVAHLYPEESARRLRSFLNMNEEDSLVIETSGKIVTGNTNAAEISNESGGRVVISRADDTKTKKQYYPERPNLGSQNPDLFKNHPGEIEVKEKKKKRNKPEVRKEVTVDSLSSDSFSTKLGKSEDDDESRDLFVSNYKNRDWLSKEVHSRKHVPRVTSDELKQMLDEFKKGEKKNGEAGISITTLQDINTRQGTDTDGRSPPKILSEDDGSFEFVKAHKANYSVRKRKDLETIKECEIVDRPTIVPTVEKSRSSSMISESHCHVNSFVAEPRKKKGRKNIPESSSTLNIIEMDRVFPQQHLSKVSLGRSASGEQESQKSLGSLDLFTSENDRGKSASHSLIFKRIDSEYNEIPKKESTYSELKIESIDNTPITSKGSFSFSRPRNSRSDVKFTDRITSINTRDEITPPKVSDIGLNYKREVEQELGNRMENASPDSESLDGKRQDVERVSSSGIRGDGFEAATLLEIVEAMLRAKKEHEQNQLKGMKRDGVLVRNNSSDVSMFTEFVPPEEIVQELEELRRSLETLSQGSPPRSQPEESDREFAEGLLQELLSRKSSPEEIIRKLEERTNGSSTLRQAVPEVPLKKTRKHRRRKLKKSPNVRKKRHKEFNANLYPEEPVKKLWSLLKLNDREYSLTTTQAPVKLLKRGSIGDHSKDNDLSLVLSKTKSNNTPSAKKSHSVSLTNVQPTKVKSDVKSFSAEGIFKMSKIPKTELRTSSKENVSHSAGPSTKANSELTTTSKEGSNITNVNININIDSHSSHNVRAQVDNVDKAKQETSSSGKRETAKKGEDRRSDTSVNRHQPTKPKDTPSRLEIPMNPKTRARALSEHLSQSSLHTRKSFQSISYRESPIRGTVQMEPDLLDKDKPDKGAGSSNENRKTRNSKELLRTSPRSSTGRVLDKAGSPKNLSTNLNDDAQLPTKESFPTKHQTASSSQQSLNRPEKKASNKSALINKPMSGSKISLETKGSGKSSKLLTTEGGTAPNTLVYKQSRSPSRSSVVPTEFKVAVGSTIPFEHQKTVDQDTTGMNVTPVRRISEEEVARGKQEGGVSDKSLNHTEHGIEVDTNSHRAGDLPESDEKQAHLLSPGLATSDTKKSNSPGRESSPSLKENKIDEVITVEPGLPSNKGIDQEKYDTSLTPGKGMTPTNEEKLSEKEPTLISTETKAQRRSDHEIVTPMIEEIVDNFHQDASNKPNGAGDRLDTADQRDHPLNNTEFQTDLKSNWKSGSENADDQPQFSDVSPKTDLEGTPVAPQSENEDVVKAAVKAPNADPPRIERSDADLSDEKEANVSSIKHDSMHEYNKYDSEQEFKRQSPTDPIPVAATSIEKEEDQKPPNEKMDKPQQQSIDTSKKRTEKRGNKNKRRKSSENEDNGTKKHRNSEERDKSDGDGKINEETMSPVISKEDIASDNTNAQRAEDGSESSLT